MHPLVRENRLALTMRYKVSLARYVEAVQSVTVVYVATDYHNMWYRLPVERID